MSRACMFVAKAVSGLRKSRHLCSISSSGNTNELVESSHELQQQVEALVECVSGRALVNCRITLTHSLFHDVVSRINDPDRAVEFFKWSLNRRHEFIHTSSNAKQMVDTLERMHKHEEAEELLLRWKLQYWPDVMRLYGNGEDVVAFMREMGLKSDDVDVLNKCLRVLCKYNRLMHAWMVFEEAKRLGVAPDVRTYIVLIRAMATSRSKAQLVEIVAEARASGFMDDATLCAAIVRGHARVEGVEKGFQVLEELVRSHNFTPDAGTYDVLVDGLCEAGRVDEGLKVLEGVESDGRMFGRIVHGYLNKGNVDKARELLIMGTRKHGVVKVLTYNCVFDAFCKSCRVREAYDFLKEVQTLGFVPDVYSYTILIDGLCKSGMPVEAKGLLEIMLNNGCTPDAKTYGPLFHELGISGKAAEAKSLLENVSSSCIDVMNYNNTIAGYCKAGDLKGAYECLEEMVENGHLPNVFTYNILLGHLSLRESYKLLHGMYQEGVMPDIVSLSTLINALLQKKKERSAWKLLREMIHERCCQPNLYTFNIVLKWLCKKQVGQLDEAFALIEQMASRGYFPDLITYDILIGGLCSQGRLEEAQLMLGAMVENDCTPTMEICNAMIKAWCRSGFIDKALEMLQNMTSMGVAPDARNYHHIVVQLCRFGKVDEAIALLQHMPCAGNQAMLHVLVQGLIVLQMKSS